ncbi:hypothetical protein [Brevifollis gellanilyticus]|uniref:Uncharacterized protein n=1 Tax=Brevifollis gellanilyticus TaxID=748831 RepID=A0A512MHD9_9BACT|nr:hypothetical protein [Brevifollis gellanilyticus]GEP46158.1 hypothetical protein BGE01nite_54490 [Brevifollis gellanilyticus]
MSGGQHEPPLPFNLSKEGLASAIYTQALNVWDANTPQTKAEAKQLFDTLREQTGWHFVDCLQGLFNLYRHKDGRWSAQLSLELQARVNSIKANTHTDTEAKAVTEAIYTLGACANFPPGATQNRLQTVSAKVVYETLHEHLMPRLRAIMLADPKSKKSLAKKLKKDLADAIDSYASPDGTEPRQNASSVNVGGSHGEQSRLLIEVLAIEVVRQYVERRQKLPTKQAVQELLIKKYPKTGELSSAKWAKLWKQAGLENLPKAARWTKKK